MKKINLIFLFIILFSISYSQPYKWIKSANDFPLDSDAIKYATNAGLSGANQIILSRFVKKLKTHNYWNKFIIIRPFLGTTYDNFKLNLKSPYDADSSYRLTAHGTTTNLYQTNKVQFNASDTYFDQHFIPSTHTELLHNMQIIYVTSTTTGNLQAMTGCLDASNNEIQIDIQNSTDYSCVQFSENAHNQSIKKNGIHILNSNNSSGFGFKFLNGRYLYGQNGINYNLPTVTMPIGCRNNNGVYQQFTNSDCQFYAIGKFMYHSDIVILNRIIEEFLRDANKTYVVDNQINTCYFFGNSNTMGFNGISYDTTRYSRKLSVLKNWYEFNCGISGTCLTNTEPKDVYAPMNLYDLRYTAIPFKTPNILKLFFAYGVNDVRSFGSSLTVTQFIDQYRTILELAHDRGWNYADIRLISIFYNENYGAGTSQQMIDFNTGIYNLSLELGCEYRDGWNWIINNGGLSLLYSDKLHLLSSTHTAFGIYLAGLE